MLRKSPVTPLNVCPSCFLCFFAFQDALDATRPLLDLEKEAEKADFNLLTLQTTGAFLVSKP